MSLPDYRGARGSNAGDDFHELWALRQTLGLLEHGADLTAISLEGLRAEDEAGLPLDTWAGVDCALYHGSEYAESAVQIEVVQLKYSGANPEALWTIARLTRSSGKTVNNSVVRRLAASYKGLLDKRNGSGDGIVVRLVSNQAIAPEVFEALNGGWTAHYWAVEKRSPRTGSSC